MAFSGNETLLASLHFGQLLPFNLVLLFIEASHSCPFLHCHQTCLIEPATTSVGFKLPFLVGCHSFVISGCVVAKSLYPTSIFD